LCWCIVVLVYCCVGLLLCWCIVVLVYCCVGVLSCFGVLSCWCIVLSVYCHVGLLLLPYDLCMSAIFGIVRCSRISMRIHYIMIYE
jgi:hypothetical protein